MSRLADGAFTVVCLASYFKGVEFLCESKRQGWRVALVTRQKWRNEDWPWESIDDFLAVPDVPGSETIIEAVTQFARSHRIDSLVALEEYDVVTAGLIREHLQLPGMVSSDARYFRDKLSMCLAAQEAGINVPAFVHVLNYDALREFMLRVPPPWVLKPRSDVSAVGIRKLESSEELWRAIDELDARENPRDRSPHYLLESFIPGEVFHVDSLVADGKVSFAGVNRYGRPPMEVAHKGGVFLSHTVEYDSKERKQLLDLNSALLNALPLDHGATHAEFIRGAENQQFYFLEVAARVGGAYIAELLESATGVNLWREWARIELARNHSRYQPPESRREYAGIALSLARQEYPDTSGYNDGEISYRVRKRHHVGLIIRSRELARILELLSDYSRRFAGDFVAIAPPLEKPE